MVIDKIISGLTLITTALAAYFAWRIGVRQNKINEQALKISDFVEIFLMPQQVILQDSNNQSQQIIKWNILVKNVSSYPIYLNDFTLNDLKHEIGNTAIPNNSDSWYCIPISEDIQNKKEFSLVIYFEDYLGKKYLGEGVGVYNGISWEIKSKKRVCIDNKK